MQRSLKKSTRENYERITNLYFTHCHNLKLVALPASWDSLSSFAITLQDSGLKVATVRSYLSAVKSKNQLAGHLLPQATELQLDRLFMGMDNTTVERDGPAPPLPAMPATTIVEFARRLEIPGVNLNSKDSISIALVVFGFLFALRATSVAAARHCDIQLSPTHITFHEIKRKTKKAQTVRRVDLPIQQCIPAQALHKFLTSKLSTSPKSTQVLFNLGSGTPNVLVNRALKSSFQSLSQQPPFEPSSHCLRRGAVVSMYAVGVPVQRILSWGAWASEESMKIYVKGRAWNPPTDADRQCFAWMASL